MYNYKVLLLCAVLNSVALPVNRKSWVLGFNRGRERSEHLSSIEYYIYYVHTMSPEGPS